MDSPISYPKVVYSCLFHLWCQVRRTWFHCRHMFLCQHMLEEGPDWKWFVTNVTIWKLGRVAWGQDHLVRKRVMACESISGGKKDFWINPKPAVACQLEGSYWSNIMTESSFCFWKWESNSDTDYCINVCLKFWVDYCMLTHPIVLELMKWVGSHGS
jgi:hypothetical protein